MHGQEKNVRVLCRLAGRACSRITLCLAGKLVELFSMPGITECHVVAGARENGPELSSHQPRSQDADAHATHPERMQCGGSLLRRLVLVSFELPLRPFHDKDLIHDGIPRIVDTDEEKQERHPTDQKQRWAPM